MRRAFSFALPVVCAGFLVPAFARSQAHPTTPPAATDAGSAAAPAPNPYAANRLVAIVTGLRNDRGLVRCSLHNSARTFPRDSRHAVAHAASRIAGRVGRCEWTGIPPGTYAVAMHHDEDGDDVFDTGFLGIPLEGYGFSRNARPFLGPPSFDAARFSYPGGNGQITFVAQY